MWTIAFFFIGTLGSIIYILLGRKPKAPAIVYSNSGWINWGHWLGTNRKATKEIVYVDYTTAKNILKKHDIRTFREYKQFIINFSSEYSLPSMPVRTYKNEWLGSKDFFGK